MSKVGVLGSAVVATTGSTIAYTCPTGKSAVLRVMYRGVAGVNSTLSITINGIVIFITAALTTGQVQCSTPDNMHVANPTLDGNGASDSYVGLGPGKFYLTEGQTVVYTIATADFSSMNFQVIGAELDLPT